MHAAVLTFPGHLFQTMLCVSSIQTFYPEIDGFCFVLDDVESSPWSSYTDDCAQMIADATSRSFEIYRTSEIPGINTCVAGWWRQQLVKLCLDRIIPGEQWLVVDGDCIFETRCDVQNRVPVTRRHARDSRFGIMTKCYVRTLLDIPQGHLEDQGDWVCTNGIPFRYLDSMFLQSLRSHVETIWQADIVDLHLSWFHDQSIVADHDPPDRMTMSEWELMECFRRYVLEQAWPFQDIGSGYSLGIDRAMIAQKQNVFRHAYQWDVELGREMLASLGCCPPSDVWASSLEWHANQQRQGQRG